MAWHQTHVEWVGCTLHDLIQPSFSFLVGSALAFSVAAHLDCEVLIIDEVLAVLERYER